MKKFLTKFSRFLLISLVAAPCVQADDYADARAEMVAAYQAQNYPSMVVAAGKSVEARPGWPGALFNLALAHALNGDASSSLDTLDALLKQGIDFGADEMGEFAALRDLPEWVAFQRGVGSLYEPVGRAEVALQLDIDRFIPEGIAFDADGSIYLGSIFKGQLVRVGDGPQILSERQGHWSVFGMRFDDDGSLWFASSAVAQMDGVGDDAGKAGLFRLDVATGEVTRSALLPQYEDEQVLGDLVVGNDAVFTTDSLTGAVYRYDIEVDEFTTIVERGEFGSPQGLVLDTTGEYLYVADYIGGLYRVSLDDGSRVRLRLPDSVIDYGIDGLYRYKDELIAIQNGFRPHRVVAFRLSDDGLGIQAARQLASNLGQFDEPTLGAIRGDNFYFVANSHWNRYDAENRLPDGLSGPIILIISLLVD